MTLHAPWKIGSVVSAALLLLAACAPATAPKPEAPAQSGPAPRAAAKEKASKQTGPAAGRSSLDALREGKKPASGPLKEVYFEFDSYDLKPAARETLKAGAKWLKENASARVQIEGHCDERGTNEYNLALGSKRAQAAKDYLVTLGVSAARLTTISYGEELPVCKDKSEECWQKNRRDRFVVTSGRPAT